MITLIRERANFDVIIEINKKNRIINQECINLLEEKPCKLNIEIMKNFYKGWDIENIKNI